MTITRTILTVAVTALGLTAITGTAQASHRHIETLAHRLDGQVRELVSEVRTHYRHTPQYRHLISDTGVASRLASHIHGVAHRHGSAYHMSNDLDRLDDLYHHMSRLIAKIEHNARVHGVGHVHGKTLHVRILMTRIHNTLEHLQDDVDDLLHHSNHDFHRPRVIIHNGGHHGGHNGIRINAGGFTFRFGH